jgi:hypothetical protein
MFLRIAALAERVRQSRSGAVAIQVGLLAVVLIGMSALGVEIGFAYSKQRQMQSAADAAATGGAAAIGDTVPDPTGEARSIAGRLGFVNGVSGVVVTVNHPPLHGTHIGDTNSVEVIVQQPQTLSMANLVTSWYGSGPQIWTVSASAVATANVTGTACIVALDPSNCSTSALTIKNNAIIQPAPCATPPRCGVAVNSTCSNALTVENNAQINAPVYVHGRWVLGQNAKLNCTPKTQGAPTVKDPYADTVFSAVGLTPRTQPTGCTTCTLQPGYYSAGLNYSNGKTLNLTPGAYYIGTKLSLQNNVTVNAPPTGTAGGVTIVINGPIPYQIDIGNNAHLNITAPTKENAVFGAIPGIAIAASPDNTLQQKFNNNTFIKIQGAIYIPKGSTLFDNNTFIASTTCTQLFAGKISYQNNATLVDTGCPSFGGTPAAGGSGLIQLTE